jgi:hypothetical protein
MVGWFPLYVFQHLNVCGKFVGLLHLDSLYLCISDKMMHYANQTISGAAALAMNFPD